MPINKFFPSMTLGRLCRARWQPVHPSPPTDAPGATALRASRGNAGCRQPATAAERPRRPKPTPRRASRRNSRTRRKGYKVVQRDGQTLYCKREKVIGSTIPTMQCMTEVAVAQPGGEHG